MYSQAKITAIHQHNSMIKGYCLIVSLSIAPLNFFLMVLLVSISWPLHHCTGIKNKMKHPFTVTPSMIQRVSLKDNTLLFVQIVHT